MTALDLAALDAALAAAHAEVVRLCAGGRWTMRIPVDEARDSDTVIEAAIDAGHALLAVARRAAAQDTALRALVEKWRADADRHDAAEPTDTDGLLRAISAARWRRQGATELLAVLDTHEEGTDG